MCDTEVASWIREEHDLVEGLSDRLLQHVAVVPRTCTADWIAEAGRRFEEFASHLQKHMTLEEHGGYLSAVAERRPTLSPRVDRLCQEHKDLNQLLEDLRELLTELKPDRPLLVREFCGRIVSLIGYVEHHEDEENDLVEFVFTYDIGTKD